MDPLQSRDPPVTGKGQPTCQLIGVLDEALCELAVSTRTLSERVACAGTVLLEGLRPSDLAVAGERALFERIQIGLLEFGLLAPARERCGRCAPDDVLCAIALDLLDLHAAGTRRATRELADHWVARRSER